MTRPPRRIWGLETEHGITCAATDDAARPPMDAEEAARRLFAPVVRMGRSSNVFLANGGRLYLDVGSHPEYATAECDLLPDLLAQDRAGSTILRDLAAQANQKLATEGIPGRIHLFRNNLDTVGNSYGCHENYLIHRRGDYRTMVGMLVPHFVTRQILVGSGHVRSTAGHVQYEFSQRAGQMWDALSSATTRSRPIVNTRDEPHADVDRYRRLHVIVGDSNMAEGATLLKVAATDMLLALAESGARCNIELQDPMAAIREVSRDLTGTVPVPLSDGRTMTPIAIQRHYLNAVVEAFGSAPSEWHGFAIDLWDRGLTALERGDHSLVASELDWAIKERVIERYLARPGSNVAGLRRLLLAYHDITGSLFERLEEEGLARRFTSVELVARAVGKPPETTRAHVRGKFIAAAQARRRDFTVDWMNLRLADPPVGTVMLPDPFEADDEKVEHLMSLLGGE